MKTNILFTMSFLALLGLYGQKVSMGRPMKIDIPKRASVVTTPYYNKSDGNEYYMYIFPSGDSILDSSQKEGLYYVKLDSLGGIATKWYIGSFWMRQYMDINNDKKLDFGLFFSRLDSLEIYRQVDSFKFEKTKWNYKVPTGSLSLMTADMNNDGKQDIIFNNVYARNFEIAYQIDSVNYTIKSIKIPLNEDVTNAWMYAADFNSDGKTDIAWRNDDYDNSFFFYMQQDSGNLSIPIRMVSAGNIFDTDILDMNNDGLLDIILAATTNQGASYIKYWTQKSTGLFNSPVVSHFTFDSLASYDGNFLFKDLNCDGFLDAIHVGYKYSNPMKYRVYNCGNNFKFNNFKEIVLGTENLYNLTFCDFNMDGRPDLLGTNSSSKDFTAMFNTSLPQEVTYIPKNIVTYDTTLTGNMYSLFDTLYYEVVDIGKYGINGVEEDCYDLRYYGNEREYNQISITADTVYDLETNMCNQFIKDTIHFSYEWKSGIFLYQRDNILIGIQTIPKRLFSQLEEIGEQSIQIYPNPSADKVNIKLPLPLTSAEIEWRDLNGRKVYPAYIKDGREKMYDVTQLPEGNYIIMIKDIKGLWTKKLRVKH